MVPPSRDVVKYFDWDGRRRLQNWSRGALPHQPLVSKGRWEAQTPWRCPVTYKCGRQTPLPRDVPQNPSGGWLRPLTPSQLVGRAAPVLPPTHDGSPTWPLWAIANRLGLYFLSNPLTQEEKPLTLPFPIWNLLFRIKKTAHKLGHSRPQNEKANRIHTRLLKTSFVHCPEVFSLGVRALKSGWDY